jgi:hypothetical protein
MARFYNRTSPDSHGNILQYSRERCSFHQMQVEQTSNSAVIMSFFSSMIETCEGRYHKSLDPGSLLGCKPGVSNSGNYVPSHGSQLGGIFVSFRYSYSFCVC